MKMLNLLVLLLLAKTISAQGTLYVHAASGVVLRKTPDKSGEKIATLPRDGKSLSVLAPAEAGNQFTAEQCGDFSVKGGWVKIKTSGGQTGYAFQGYLSKYPPVLDQNFGDRSPVERFYSAVSPFKGQRVALPEAEDLVEGYRQDFEDGAWYKFEAFEGGSTAVLSAPKGVMSIQEAMVIFRPLWFGAAKSNCSWDSASKTLTLMHVDGYEQINIMIQDNRLMVEFSAAD